MRRTLLLLMANEGSTVGSTSDGLSATLRDQFTTAINPMVDGPTEPGGGSTAGLRDVTGSLWKIIDGSLRGGMQAVPVWGSSKVVWTTAAGAGITRADGVTLWGLIEPTDKQAHLGFGWATTTAVTDPSTNGHHWLVVEGYPAVSVPSILMYLSDQPDVGKVGAFRPTQYLVAVVLRATGAFYLISSHAAHTRTGVSNSNDYVGIPVYPQARVLWVDDATTTTPMYPHISALAINGPQHLHFLDDLRVKTISSWATDTGLATFLDRITRANSTTSIGAGWTNDVGVFGVTSNKVHCETTAGHNVAWANSGLTGDGHWRCKITAPTSVANQFGFMFRRASLNNYCFLHNGGGANIVIHKNVAGAFTQITSLPFTWTAAQVYDIDIICKGNQIQVYIDNDLKLDWFADGAGSTFTSAAGFGPYCFNTTATGGRWDDFMAVPLEVTLPADLQIGARPSIFTVGSTIATDDFTAANGTAISGRTTTTGAKTWTTVGAGWEINTNRARNTNTGGAEVDFFAHIDAGQADYETSVAITTKPSGDRLLVGIVTRYVDADNHTYLRILIDPGQPTNHEIELWERTGGVTLDTCKHQLGDHYDDATAYTLTVQVVGPLLHCFLGTEPILSYVFAGQITGTKTGLYHSGADDGSSFDTFTVKALT
jgi:hypothetical protein